MGLNLNILSLGSGSQQVSGTIAKYATAASLPGSAADGDVGITLDTNNLYSYDSGVAGWVIIGGPGVAITVSDTNSVDLSLTLNVLTANLNIPGFTTIPTTFQGITLSVYSGSSPGLVANIKAYPILGATSTSWNITGSTFPVMGGTLTLDIPPASSSNAGLMNTGNQTFAGTKFFNDVVTGFSGFGIVSTGPQTIYLNSPAVIPSSYNLFFPKDIGTTFAMWLADGQGGVTLSQISATFLSGITGPVIANGPGVGIAVMQAGGITLANFTGIDPLTRLGNPTGATAGVTTITAAVEKSLLGISNNNFGDVTLGTFLYAGSAFGATISAAQLLSLTWGDTTNPGAVGPTHQVWSGDKRTTGNFGAVWFQFFGGSLVSLGASASAGYTIMLPAVQGGTFTNLQNNGLGQLTWVYPSSLNGYRTVTNAGATLNIQDKMIEITTGVTNQTLNVGWGTGNTGVVFTVMKIDSGLGNVTIQSDRGINGVTNFIFSSQWETHQFVDNGVEVRAIT